jgi:alpha-1,3-mannosyltransferase
MKILQLTRQFLPAQGGMESVVEGLSVALQHSGHHVQVATLRLLFSTGTLAPAESVEAGSRCDECAIGVRAATRWRRLRCRRSAVTNWSTIHAIDFFVDYLSLLRWLHHTRW